MQTHSRRPMSRPYGRVMGRILRVNTEKSIVVYRCLAVPINTYTCDSEIYVWGDLASVTWLRLRQGMGHMLKYRRPEGMCQGHGNTTYIYTSTYRYLYARQWIMCEEI